MIGISSHLLVDGPAREVTDIDPGSTLDPGRFNYAKEYQLATQPAVSRSAFGQLAQHQMSRRGFLGAAAIAGAAFGLAACSAPYNDAKTLTYTFWGSGPEKTAVTDVVKAFAKSVDLTPKAQNIPVTDYETKLNTIVAGSNPPDAGYLFPGMAMRFGEQGKLVNALDFPEIDQFMPSVVHFYDTDKAVTQINLEAYALWYDKAALREIGQESLPTTPDQVMDWDSFIALADRLTVDDEGRHPSDSGFNPERVERYGFGSPTWLAPYSVLLKTAGVDMFDEDGTRCFFDSDAAVKVFQAINDMIFEHRVSPNGAQMGEISGSIASGRVAMNLDGQWTLIDLNPVRLDSGFEFDVAIAPSFGQGAWTSTMSSANGVFANSDNKEDATELLMQLSDPAQVPLFANGLWMPVLDKFYSDDALRASWMDNDDHPAGYRDAVAEMAFNNQFTYPDFRIKNWPEIDAAIAGFLTGFVSEKADVRDQCVAMAEAVNPLMQGAYIDTI